MAEKRLIDANALTDTIEETDWYHVSLQGNLVHGARSDIHTPLYKADDIYQALKDAPTVDAVEVVRCKDCEHYKPYLVVHKGVNLWYCEVDGRVAKSKHFCSYGERKTT